MSKKLLLILFIGIIVIPPAYSIGLAHGETDHYFEPNKEISIEFQVRGVNRGTEGKVSISGDLEPYTTYTEPDANGRFYVVITLPESLEPPGIHKVMVTAKAVPLQEASGMIATLTAVNVPVKIVVPYEGKYLKIDGFSASNANIGEEANFKVTATNWGTEPISSARAKIDVYDPDGKYLSSLNTDSVAAQPEERIEMQAFWDTSGRSRGIYSAKARVSYDGKSADADEVEFRIGELLVSLVDYTKTLEIGGLKPMNIEVESEWSGEIFNVYAEVELDNSKFKSPPIDLKRFEKGKLTAYIDTDKFNEGPVDGKLTIFYGNDKKTTVEDITITFTKSEEESEVSLEFSPMYLVVIGLIIIIFILVLLFLRKETGKRKRR